jgi:pimeloyl-ACP methyl ester carboxylesterase
MRAIAVLALLLCVSPAEAGTRAYLINGLGGEIFTGAAMNELAGKFRRQGAEVVIGSWAQASSFAADACAHRFDRIVIVGHSLGALGAAEMANDMRACGARGVRVVMVDPPVNSSVGNGSAVNFVGSFGTKVSGARNIPASGQGHIGMMYDEGMQRRILQAAH